MGKGRSPCCDKTQVKRGPWCPSEDIKLINYIQKHGHENWRALPKQAGLLRCGKSCRLRWINYLRPDLKRGNFTQEEEEMIIKLHQSWGNKWAKIASQFPGRTDNEIKNIWNTHLKKRLARMDTNLNADESTEKWVSIATSSNDNVSRDDTNVVTKQDDEKNQWVMTKKPRVIKTESETSSNVANPNYKIDVNNNQGPNEMRNVVIKQEVGEIPIEIPSENDSDFWNMLDGISNSLESENSVPQLDNVEEIGNGYLEEIETKRWLEYLECKLGLDEKPVGDQIKNSSGDANTDQSEILGNSPSDNSGEPEADSKIGYPKNWP